MTTDVIRNFKTSVKVKVKVWVKPINFLGLILLQYLYSHYYSVVYHYIYTWYYTSEIDNTFQKIILMEEVKDVIQWIRLGFLAWYLVAIFNLLLKWYWSQQNTGNLTCYDNKRRKQPNCFVDSRK